MGVIFVYVHAEKIPPAQKFLNKNIMAQFKRLFQLFTVLRGLDDVISFFNQNGNFCPEIRKKERAGFYEQMIPVEDRTAGFKMRVLLTVTVQACVHEGILH
ncbi:MAG: hypothetical protein SWC96_12605 [Thermodesulfobacteriota bacterium]|nr:hypothetical protein [Thermodesulfobacteriota bacterium]